ncbi:MAG TPA: helix-hairpin-helix domain-containing protein, partial [Myxococcota bacterium]|nr:helix-hairpin-helix domain-containing protein [Myxococcota bacterium]
LVERGSLGLLARLEGEVSGEALLATLPGIGPELAARIHEELAIDSLEELELAAHDGRLEGVRGFGPRRVRAVRESLAATLGRSTRHRARRLARRVTAAADTRATEAAARPSVVSLLAVDADYRARAEAGELRRIAPRRFNPEGEAWLPILHAEKEGWHVTALFSNTARAHELKKTRDWVVIFYERNGDEGQCTVVSAPRGALAGKRVIRGREPECEALYAPRAGRTRLGFAAARRSASTPSKGPAT